VASVAKRDRQRGACDAKGHFSSKAQHKKIPAFAPGSRLRREFVVVDQET